MGMIDDGGAAFPRVGEGFGDPNYDAPGMTLRDHFAGQALQALIANPKNSGDARVVVKLAYSIADAMLAARKEPTNV